MEGRIYLGLPPAFQGLPRPPTPLRKLNDPWEKSICVVALRVLLGVFKGNVIGAQSTPATEILPSGCWAPV